MLNELKNSFKQDVKFSGWTDTLGITTDRKIGNSFMRLKGEVKDPNSNKKIRVISGYGIKLQFMEGNKVIETVYWADAVKDASFENKVAEYLNFSFAECRKAYRSLMTVVSNVI